MPQPQNPVYSVLTSNLSGRWWFAVKYVALGWGPPVRRQVLDYFLSVKTDVVGQPVFLRVLVIMQEYFFFSIAQFSHPVST